MSTALPEGFRIALDPGCRWLNDSVLFGGSPARAMKLSPAGRRALEQLREGPVSNPAMAVLARRLIDAGLAHPRPPRLPARPDVTVIVPVRDRAAQLTRCLSAIGRGYPVLVVDDGSADPTAIADVCARFGASLIRRPVNGGPGAARDTGLAAVATEFIAFVDSDCRVAEGWAERLLEHFTDPLVAIAAPRVRASPGGGSSAARFAAVRGGLDMGPREARVVPLSTVAYVPTAALVARRSALVDVAHGGRVFDPALRYGEDVDLVWRLHAAGWRIRYEPASEVWHDEPADWPTLLRRRYHYGTSAAPLARRHPDAMAPLILQPGPTLAVMGVLSRRPSLALAGYVLTVVRTLRTTRAAAIPDPGAARSAGLAIGRTAIGVGQFGTQFGAPLLVAALIRARGSARLAVAGLLLGPALAGWVRSRPALDPLRFTAGQLADDIAYGAGVWTGSRRERTLRAVLPATRYRPVACPDRPSSLAPEPQHLLTHNERS